MEKENYLLKIIQNKELSSGEKLVMVYFLICYDNDLEKEINLTNQEISYGINCSMRIISDYINSLINKGYLEFVRFDGRKRFLKISKI